MCGSAGEKRPRPTIGGDLGPLSARKRDWELSFRNAIELIINSPCRS
jgi:hypothetical protein